MYVGERVAARNRTGSQGRVKLVTEHIARGNFRDSGGRPGRVRDLGRYGAGTIRLYEPCTVRGLRTVHCWGSVNPVSR
jgi:hypothetical protein